MPSHLDRPRRRERRKHFRLGWHLPATIYDAGRHLERPCTLVDFSNGGAKLAGIRAYTIPDEFRLRTPLGDRRSCRVIWRTEDTLGVEFTDHVMATTILATGLVRENRPTPDCALGASHHQDAAMGLQQNF